MQPGTPSATAISVASLRAAHLHLFNGPKIHEDTFALQMSGARDVEDLRARLSKTNLPYLQRVSAYFACRHRFSEDRMRAALDRGVRQLVLLGAGLDTLALREPDITNRVRVIEVDHPDSQRWKLDRLRALGITTTGVQYVPVDFSSQDLKEELGVAGVRMEHPTFFAWLGVTQYITESAAIATLSLLPAGTRQAQRSCSMSSFPSRISIRTICRSPRRHAPLRRNVANHGYPTTSPKKWSRASWRSGLVALGR